MIGFEPKNVAIPLSGDSDVEVDLVSMSRPQNHP